jgi:hypothetical protein
VILPNIYEATIRILEKHGRIMLEAAVIGIYHRRSEGNVARKNRTTPRGWKLVDFSKLANITAGARTHAFGHYSFLFRYARLEATSCHGSTLRPQCQNRESVIESEPALALRRRLFLEVYLLE